MTLNAYSLRVRRVFQDGALAVIISYIQKLFTVEIGDRLLIHYLDKLLSLSALGFAEVSAFEEITDLNVPVRRFDRFQALAYFRELLKSNIMVSS